MSAPRTSRPNRPARPARPAAMAPPGVDMMDRTHRQTQQALDQMLQLAGLLAGPGQEQAAAPLAREICDFFNGPARGHHELEETLVFPALLAQGDAALREHVRRLQQDHMWLEEDWLELEPHLQAVANGYCNEHRNFLQAGLAEFAGLCHEHMALEESLVHPDARRGLVTPGAHA